MENQNVYEKPVTLKNIVKFAVPTNLACYGGFYHARHRRQRGHHEKDGGTKDG